MMKQTGRIGQAAPSYTSTGGVCMVKNKEKEVTVEVIHTVPVMTDIEKRIAERRVSNDLFNVLSDIYAKLNVQGGEE